MPYIRETSRLRLHEYIDNHVFPSSPGELNYVITTICHNFVADKGLNYRHMNTVIGALECAKQEFYRMVAAPYEDKKRKENGPISELDSDEPRTI